MNRKDCAHRRTSFVTEEYFEPLFGVEVPVERTTFRICDDCGMEMPADSHIVVADPSLSSLYGSPAE